MRGSFVYATEHIQPKIIAEIGVASGDNALEMLMHYPVEYMLLADCYLPYTDSANHEVLTIEKQNKKLLETLYKVMPRGFLNKIVFSCMTSEKISQYYPDKFFDYVYIDARHDYDNVKRDISLWYNKVKDGGVLGGHDYQGYYDGVTRAVNEFKEKHANELSFIQGSEYDWAFHKK